MINRAASIGAYLPVGGEPDPAMLLRDFTGEISLPALTHDNQMITFRRWADGQPVIAAPWGGLQPEDVAAVIIPQLVFIPMVGFDTAFNRIGQGGGHYDRYLAAHPRIVRIGIAWDVQRVDSIAAQPWDIPMDAILTDQRLYVKDLTRCQRP